MNSGRSNGIAMPVLPAVAPSNTATAPGGFAASDTLAAVDQEQSAQRRRHEPAGEELLMINAGRRQWRRLHHDGTVAEVTPLADLVFAWEACVRRRGRVVSRRQPRTGISLFERGAGGGRLAGARAPFDACDEQCGFWDPVSGERTAG